MYSILDHKVVGIIRISQRSRKIRRPDEDSVDTIDSSYGIDIFQSLPTFNLHDNAQFIGGITHIIGYSTPLTRSCQDSSYTTNSLWGISDCLNHKLSLLRRIDHRQKEGLRP